MTTMHHFTPLVNETADELARRYAAAWSDLEPDDAAEWHPEPEDEAFQAETSPLNDPNSPLWEQRWTITEAPSLAPLYALDSQQFQALCDAGPDVTQMTTHQLIRLYYAAGVELQERLV